MPFTLAFLLMAAYWPGIAGVATTPRWDVGVLFAGALLFAPASRLTAVHKVGLALIAWLILSLAWSAGRLDGIDAAAKLVVIGCAFMLGSTLTNIKPLVAGAAVGLAISSAVAIAQWFGWSGIESYVLPAGLFYNGNRLAEAAALVFAAALALRMWWALPGLVPALVIPESRTALLAVAAVLFTMAWQASAFLRRQAVPLFAVACFGIVAMRGVGAGGYERFALWRDTLDGLTWLGRGLGSFATTFPTHAHWFDPAVVKSVPEHPHSEWLWLAYEGGIGAVALCGALAILLWSESTAQLRLVLVALAVESLFAMPFHDPATVLFGALVAGHCVARGRAVRDPAVARRVALRQRLPAVAAE